MPFVSTTRSSTWNRKFNMLVNYKHLWYLP